MSAQLTVVRDEPDSFFTQSDLRLIRQTVAKDTNDEEFAYFIRVASLRRLNPLLGQIRMNVYSKDNYNKRQAVIITTIHGFRLIANRTKRYAPGRAATLPELRAHLARWLAALDSRLEVA